MSLERANPADGSAILRLLADSGLPVDGLLDHLNTALVARLDHVLVGCAVLEIYLEAALLRSVAVAAAARHRGIGKQLTASALHLAAARGVRTVYLLTTTAEGFFHKFGFEEIARERVPADVQTSVEFRSACPSSATVLVRFLVPPDQE